MAYVNDAICALCDLIATACERNASDTEIQILSDALDKLLTESM